MENYYGGAPGEVYQTNSGDEINENIDAMQNIADSGIDSQYDNDVDMNVDEPSNMYGGKKEKPKKVKKEKPKVEKPKKVKK